MPHKAVLRQECPLAFVVFSWLLYIVLIPVLAVAREWALLAVWVVLAPVLMWAYIRWFPRVAPYMGYGRLDDQPALIVQAPIEVTLYTALGCPFCPIVKHRLQELQPKMGFRLHEVDVTARPDILTRKGVWSVPVVEVGSRRLVGHGTSAQLAAMIAGRAGESLPAA